MKRTTKKKLRAVMSPIVFVWSVLAIIIAVAGISLEALAYAMLGDVQMAKLTIKNQLMR